jgi:hypothetical protein
MHLRKRSRADALPCTTMSMPDHPTGRGVRLISKSSRFPPIMGATGKFEILGKFAKANFSGGKSLLFPDCDQKTNEVNLNYIIKDFNARVMFFYVDKRFNRLMSNDKQFGVGLQLQM